MAGVPGTCAALGLLPPCKSVPAGDTWRLAPALRPLCPRRQWMAQHHAASDHMPTQRQLRDTGAHTLENAIACLGGLAEFSRRFGIPLAVRHPNGYWDDFANLAAELAPFLTEAPQAAGSSGTDSSSSVGSGTASFNSVLTAGANSSAGTAAANGTSSSGVQRRRLRPPLHLPRVPPAAGAPAGAAAVQPPPAQRAQRQRSPQLVFPKMQQLIAAGRLDLVGAIRKHGGRVEVARRLGAALPHGRLRTAEQVREQLLQFVRQQQRAQQQQQPAAVDSRPWLRAAPAMPTSEELRRAGRADLAAAVKRFGGFHYFAWLTGLAEGGAAAALAAATEEELAWERQQEQQQEREEGEEGVSPATAAALSQLPFAPSCPWTAPEPAAAAAGSGGPAHTGVAPGTPSTSGAAGPAGRQRGSKRSSRAPRGAVSVAPPLNPAQAMSSGNSGAQPEPIPNGLSSSTLATHAAGARPLAVPPPPMVHAVGEAVLAFMDSAGLGRSMLPSRQLLLELGGWAGPGKGAGLQLGCGVHSWHRSVCLAGSMHA